ncbi:MAG TPA: lysophospholipid acyltransferase family protein [Planctomycetota bacterium]|nr:lysophospholipid acyltransferase family protein [Planctomycetota bacterium]
MSDETNESAGRVRSSTLHYAAFKTVCWLASVLPLRTQYAIARMGAEIYFKLDRSAREAVCANLRAVRGPDAAPAAIREDARRVFHSFGRYLCEFFGFEHFAGQYIDRHVMIQGREHVDAALKRGRGVLFCSGHYSNWELGAWAVARMGYPITAVTLAHAHSKVNALFVRQRAQRGVKVAHSHDSVRRVMALLRANETVAMLGDRATGGPTVEVTLFGRKTHLPQGPWRIALKTGAVLLPTFVTRREENDYTLEIGAPIEISGYNERDSSVFALAQAWAERFEARLRSDPTQWEVFFPVWGS